MTAAAVRKGSKMISSVRFVATSGVVAAVVLSTACASRPAGGPSPATRIQFPPPPAQAVIEWVASYGNSSDVGAGQSALSKALVGEEAAQAALVAPTNVAIAPDGSLFVIDQKLDAVVVVDPARKRFERFAGEGGGPLSKPIALAFGPDGTLFVTDATSRAVQAFDGKGRFRASYGGPKLFERPTGVAVSPDGKRLAVCDTPKHVVYVLSTGDGSVLKKLGTEGRASDKPGEFHTPYTVAFDEEGYLYVSDYLNYRIQVFGPDGSVESSWGQAGDRPGDLSRPRGLAVDSKRGVVYEVDGAFQLVQMFNLDGELLMWFAGPGNGPGQLALPTGIDRRGDLIAVADTLNGRIQVFRFLGIPKS